MITRRDFLVGAGAAGALAAGVLAGHLIPDGGTPTAAAAGPDGVAGHPVRGGRFYGDEPSLTALDANGNLKYTVDFRSVYATVLDRVLGADPEKVLGGRFPSLAFV